MPLKRDCIISYPFDERLGAEIGSGRVLILIGPFSGKPVCERYLMTNHQNPKERGEEQEHSARLPAEPNEETFLEDWLGPAPTDEKAAELARLSEARQQGLREDLRHNSITGREVAKRLGLPHAKIEALVEERSLLAMVIDGEPFFREFQFDHARPNGTVEGLKQVLDVVDFPPLAQALWLTRRH